MVRIIQLISTNSSGFVQLDVSRFENITAADENEDIVTQEILARNRTDFIENLW